MKNIKKYLTLNNIVLVVALALAATWAWNTIQSLQKNYALQQQVDQGKLQNEVLALQNQNLQMQQNYYKTDEFLDLEAREKLNKAGPGEHLVILPKTASSANDENAPATATTRAEKLTNFEQWMQFLFGRKN